MFDGAEQLITIFQILCFHWMMRDTTVLIWNLTTLRHGERWKSWQTKDLLDTLDCPISIEPKVLIFIVTITTKSTIKKNTLNYYTQINYQIIFPFVVAEILSIPGIKHKPAVLQNESHPHLHEKDLRDYCRINRVVFQVIWNLY